MAEGVNPADRILDRYATTDGALNAIAPTETDRVAPALPPLPPSSHARLKRATFQVRDSVLDDLERYHLELQLAIGKANAPYKEVMVEAALVQFLESVRANPSDWLDLLQDWQRRRKNVR